MILSPHEVAWLVRQHWTDPADQRVAVAVALAESGGDTRILGRSASGPSVGNRDHGLFQISGRWHGDKLAARGVSWRNPHDNTRIAWQVWLDAGRSFTPWTVFGNGDYQAFLPDADIALDNPFPPGGGDLP